MTGDVAFAARDKATGALLTLKKSSVNTALDDDEFAEQMMQKLVEHQVKDTTSPYAGAFIEGFGDDRRIGQFTMQESILTMQQFLKKSPNAKT